VNVAAKTRRRAKTSSEAQKVIEDEAPLDPSELPAFAAMVRSIVEKP